MAEPGLVGGVGGPQRGVRRRAAGGAHPEQRLRHAALVGQGLGEVGEGHVVGRLAGGGQQRRGVGVGPVRGQPQCPAAAAAACQQGFLGGAGGGLVQSLQPG